MSTVVQSLRISLERGYIQCVWGFNSATFSETWIFWDHHLQLLVAFFLWKLILWTWSLRMTLLDTPRKNSDKRERGRRSLEASFWFNILCAQMCFWVQMYVSVQRIWMCACLVFACSSVVFTARDNGNLDVAQAVFPAVVQPYCSSHLFL